MSQHHTNKSFRGGDRAARDDFGERREKPNGPGDGGGRERDRERDRARDQRRYRSRSPARRDNKDRDGERPRNRDRIGHDRDNKHRERDRGKRERNDKSAGTHQERPQHHRDRDAELPAYQNKARKTGERERIRDEVTTAAPRALGKSRASRDGTAEEGDGASRSGSRRVDRRRSASPLRSPSPRRAGRDARDEEPGVGTPLPSRSKSDKLGAPSAAPVSFKVKGRDGSRGDDRGSSRDRDSDQRGQGDDEDSRGRFGDDPMEEDDEEEPVVEDDGMDAMQAMLGFGGFDSTKGKKVLGNNVGGVRKEKTTEYRQYMNRVGGFNRPLSPSR